MANEVVKVTEVTNVITASLNDGSFNLLAGGTIGGNLQLGGTLTVGANTSGHDVKFFGDGSGKYFQWDASENKALINGNLTLAGDLDVTGTTTSFNSTVVTIDDPVFTIGGDTAPSSDDNKDRGIEFRYHDGSTPRVGFFGYDDSESAFTFLTSATNSSEVFSGTLGNLKVNTVYHGDGTAASPSVRFNLDSDTGIFRPTANNLAFTTGGTEAARFDSSGKFIAKSIELDSNGADSPTLKVAYDANNYLEFAHNRINGVSSGSHHIAFQTGGTQRARLDSTGLGIGEPPSAKLHVKENSDTAPTAQFYQEHTSGRGLLVQTESQLSNRYAFKVESTGGSTNIIYAAADGNVGIGGTPIAQTYIESDNNSFAGTGVPSNYHLVLRNPQNDLSEGVGIGFTSSTGTDSIGAAIAFERTDNQAQGDLVFSAKSSTSAGASLNELMRLDGSASSVNIPDSVKLKLGGGGDLQLYHDGNHSYIINDVGHFYIRNQTDDNDIIFQCDDGSGGTETYFRLDGSTGRTVVENHFEFKDTHYALFGDGLDLQIGHAGDHSFIQHIGTGDLIIKNLTDDKDIIFESDDGAGGNAVYFRLDGSSATHDGSATTSIYTNWPDNSLISLGTGKDFAMYHDGTKTLLNNTNGNLEIRNSADDSDIIFQSDDGSGGVTPYFTIDGGSSVNIFHKAILNPDGIYNYFGNGYDLSIWHDGTNSNIRNQTGDLLIANYGDDKDIIFQSDDGSGGVATYITIDGSALYTKIHKNFLHLDSISSYYGNDADSYVRHTGTNF